MQNHTDVMPESAIAYILDHTCEQSQSSPTIFDLHDEAVQFTALFEALHAIVGDCPEQVFRAFSISLTYVSLDDPHMVGLLADEFEKLSVLISRLVYMRRFIDDRTHQLLNLTESLELKAKEAIING